MTNSFSVETYSASDVKLSIGGYIITGWDNLSINRRVKAFTPVYGIRGKNTRTKIADSSATLTISLLQTSQGNDILSQIHDLDIKQSTGRIVFMLRDNSGRSVFSSSEVYITGFPVASFSGQFEYRNWELFCQTTDTYNVGGNARPATNLLDSALSEAGSFFNNLI